MRTSIALLAGAFALGGTGFHAAQAADIYAPPVAEAVPPPQYVPPPSYAYPPPVAYYAYPAPVVVVPGPYYYARGPYWGYGPRFAYGYGRWGYRRHW